MNFVVRRLFFASLLALAPVWAQEAALSGTVQDTSGAIIPKAQVKITNRQQGTTQSVETNEAGVYQFPFLQPGAYDLEIAAPGFKTQARANLNLAVAQNVRLDFRLEVGNVSESLTVAATAEQINSESAELGSVVDNTKVVEMPLNGRTFFSLAVLSPGVLPPVQNSGLGYRGGFNVAGSCEGCNNFSLNGLDNNDNTKAIPNFRPSIDAIQEFNLLTGVYAAQYGYATGGQVIVVTKSGANGLHGTLYDFLRNQVMDARNFFQLPGPTPSFKRNQFGATLGGPIQKDRTFFFLSYEGLRLSQAVTAVTTVPTGAMMSGDFRGIPRTIKDPTTGQPVQGNMIPLSSMSPVGRALAAYYPAPTSPTAPGQLPSSNYIFNEARTETMNEGSVRLDHMFSTKDSLSATGNFYLDSSFEPQVNSCGSTFLPGYGCRLIQRSEVYGLAETHVFRSNMVNEARMGFSLTVQPAISQAAYTDFWGRFGIQSTLLSLAELPHLGTPATVVTGFNNLVGPSSFRRADPHWQWTDILSWTHGKHTVKIGGNLSHFASNNANVGSPTGSVTFTNTSQGPTTSYGLADLLLGLPASTSNQNYVYKLYLREANVSAFIQDDYKVNSRLTLNMGLRWELNTPPVDYAHHLTNFDVARGIPFVENTNGFGEHLLKYDWRDYGPRFGFAWTPFSGGKTVVRGGAGIFFNNPSFYNGLHDIYAGVPYAVNNAYTSSQSQPITLSNPFPSSNAVIASQPTGMDPNFKNAKLYEWSLGVQRQLTRDMLLEVTYFANSGSHLNNRRNINQATPGPGTPAQVNARRPYPKYGNLQFTEFGGNSHYQSMAVKLDKRYGNGLSFLMGYTYGKSIDDVGASQQCGCGAGVTNAYDYRTARGLSAFDVRHRIVFSPVYELPFGAGKPYVSDGLFSQLIGGWQVSSLFQWQTGSPLTPVLSGNFSNTGGTTDRPDLIGDPNANAPHTFNKWFNTAAFALPPLYTFGDAGKGVILGPGLVNVDLSIVRNFRIREWMRLQFRAEFFNVFNHTNFNFPNVTADTPSFGKIIGARDPRQTQLALKIVF